MNDFDLQILRVRAEDAKVEYQRVCHESPALIGLIERKWKAAVKARRALRTAERKMKAAR